MGFYKVFRTKEELREKLKEFRRESFIDSERAKKKLLKVRRRKTIILLTFIISLIVLYQLFLGTAMVKVHHYRKGYEVSINNKLVKYIVDEEFKDSVIPFFITIYDYTSSNVHPYDNNYNNDHDNFNKLKIGDNTIKIREYTCFSLKAKHKVSCDLNSRSPITKKYLPNSDYKLYIIKMNEYDKVIYSGKFINNISKYLKEEGDYVVRVKGKRGKFSMTINIYITME